MCGMYGEGDAPTRHNRWKIFYLACSELFAYGGVDIRGVAHYLFSKPRGEGETQGRNVGVCISSRDWQK